MEQEETMKRFTVEQYAGAINKMVEENGLFWAAGNIEHARDIWRVPANMSLLNETARIAARHYIEVTPLGYIGKAESNRMD